MGCGNIIFPLVISTNEEQQAALHYKKSTPSVLLNLEANTEA